MKHILVIMIFVLLSACATTKKSELENEILPSIESNRTLKIAFEALESKGFKCFEGTSINPNLKGTFECSRSQSNLWPPFGCIHRIWFSNINSKGEFEKYEIFRPVCTGL
jgi:hypothetical protein